MKTLKIIKVVEVSADAPKSYWKIPMQIIFIENFDGFCIDSFENTNWKLYKNLEIEGFYIKRKSGHNWLQVGESGIKIINEDPKQTEINSDFIINNPEKNSDNYLEFTEVDENTDKNSI